MPEAGDHYRLTEGRGAEGVYRVVGTDGAVTLLRVTDAEGRRAHTGELRRVSREELGTAFEPAADPDGGLSALRAVRNLLQGMYWEVRKLP